MLGLIHVAPLGATPHTQMVVTNNPGRGYLRVHAYPWAKVAIDGKDVGTTPIAKPIELTDGKHTVRFEHDWYVPVERQVDLPSGSADAALQVGVDFEKDKIELLAGKTIPADGEPK